MEFSQLLLERYSVRKFTNQPIESDKLDKLSDTLIKAPSSKASYPCHFYLVKDKLLIDKLSQCKPHGAAFLKDAPLVVVITADPAVSDVWIEDASIATTFLMLEVVNLELGGCWVQVRNRFYDETISSSQYVKNTLSIDESLEVLALYGVGYHIEFKEFRSNDNYSPVSIIG
ncbi:MAG: NAD(P)H-dependent dehydrogenase/reductase [Salinivirgaceae bacterium]|nr:MAG: NAD(P)H-dependent dehydrogenase/reductase [Salinivirgaceae bacterium]